ncbi:4'-phosphopantetheinyl transferase family protein [Streptomyces sp. SS8]
MSAPQRRRYSRLRTEQSRRDFLAVRALARRLVADVTGDCAESIVLAQTCPACGSEEHGPPRVVNRRLHVSWAHSGGELAVVVSDRHRVGVDVERVDRLSVTPGLLTASLPEAEAEQVAAARNVPLAFLRLWTMKEALAKLGSDMLAMTRLSRQRLADSVGAVDYWTEDRENSVIAVAVAPES